MKNSYQQSVFELIRNIVGQANTLVIPKEFIKFTGDINSALLLSQLIYWSDKSEMKDNLIAKTYKSLEDELTLTKKQCIKAINNLKRLGLIKTSVRKFSGNPTMHYQVCIDVFENKFVKHLNLDSDKR